MNDKLLDEYCAQAATEALYGGGQHRVFLRVGECDGDIVVDLCDDQWRAVRVSADGWKVVAPTPAKFMRRPGMVSLPLPVAGDITELDPFLNLNGEERALFLACLVSDFRPVGRIR